MDCWLVSIVGGFVGVGALLRVTCLSRMSMSTFCPGEIPYRFFVKAGERNCRVGACVLRGGFVLDRPGGTLGRESLGSF